MWYSSLSYQVRPEVIVPVHQVSSEKSSVTDVSDERVFALSFELLLSLMFRLLFVFRFALRFVLVLAFASRLLLLVFVIFVIATIRIINPITMKTSTAPMPRSHGQTLRFDGGGGIGDHWGCCGGGGGGGVWPE